MAALKRSLGDEKKARTAKTAKKPRGEEGAAPKKAPAKAAARKRA